MSYSKGLYQNRLEFHHGLSFQTMQLPKIGAFNFQDVDDGFGSSDDGENYQYFEEAIWQKPAMDENIPDLFPMFSRHGISRKLNRSAIPRNFLSINDSEYLLENFSNSSSANISSSAEPIECVVVNVAHLEQFPKAASPYSATLPCIFAWFDAHTAFSSEYPTTVQNYFKLAYNCIRTHLRFFFSIAPSMERLNNLSSVRREVPSGRILFHYIGYGFPDITRKNIWCSERRSREFVPFKLDSLFESLQPPTWYIFDCNNAAVVINEFKTTAERLQNQNLDGMDWNDWFCICATGVDEELPDDPRLPRDFLTSTVLTPIKMAVICHMLQFYRLNLMNVSFPLDPPCEHLWNEKKPDASRLSLALTAITDGIAADSLSPELYQKIFRSDRLSAVLFRHLLLAQYLLRPYRVHPATYPEIPDLSMHPLWRQWSILLDTAICAASIPRPTFAIDIFSRDATSFDVLMQNDQFDLIRPYHLILLFHSLFSDSSNDQSLILLSKYAADPRGDPKMLASTTIFHPLFARLLMKDPKSPVFYQIAYLILVLLYYNPDFSNDIQKDLDASHFPYIVFNKDIPEQTRLVCAALVSNLVVSHEKFQQICTSSEYLDQVRIELSHASSSLSSWLMLTVRRAFNLYSPDPAVFTENGLHIQASICLHSNFPPERAAALSMLTCFMRPFECKCNIQLLFMSLETVSDASFLVRFHLILLLKKFVMSYDSFSDAVQNSIELKNSSYKDLLYDIYDFNEDNKIIDIYSAIDQIMKADDISSRAYSIAFALLQMFSHDPHPSVSSLATTVIQFVSKQRAAFESSMDESQQAMMNPMSKNLNSDQAIVSYGDDEFEAEHLSFANLDQNESLHQIMLRFLVVPNKELPNEQIPNQLSLYQSINISENPIIFVDYEPKSFNLAASTKNSIIYIKSLNTIFKYDINDAEISDLHVFSDKVIFTTTSGSVNIWRPPKSTLEMVFQGDLRFDVSERLFAFNGIHKYNHETEDFQPSIFVVTSNGNISEWNQSSKLLIDNEIITKIAISDADASDNDIIVFTDKSNFYELNKTANDISVIKESDQMNIKFVLRRNGCNWIVCQNGQVEKEVNKEWKQIIPKSDSNVRTCSIHNNNILLVYEDKSPVLYNDLGKELKQFNGSQYDGILCGVLSTSDNTCIFGTAQGCLLFDSF